MDIIELSKKKTVIEYTTIKGKAQKEHFDAVTAYGITCDAVIESGYAELFEQLRRKNLLNSLGNKKEVIVQEQRGEFSIPEKGSIRERMIYFIEHHPDCTREQLKEAFSSDEHPKLFSNLGNSITRGEVNSRGSMPYKTYSLNSSSFKGLFPDKISVLG